MKLKRLFNKFFWYDLQYKISGFFNPRQKWLTKQIPNTWCDKVELIPRTLFACLVHFVEEENGLRDKYDYTIDIEKGHIKQEHVDEIVARDSELRSVYTYITQERPSLEKQLEQSYPKPVGDKHDFDSIFEPCEDGSGYLKLASCEKRYGMSFEEAYKEVNRIEALIADKNMWAMTTIVKYHEYLWT